MAVNIKNSNTEQLVRELTKLTGEGATEAVTVAVRERIGRINEAAKQRERFDKIMAIAAETAPLLKGFDWDDALYGENGLYDRETGLPK